MIYCLNTTLEAIHISIRGFYHARTARQALASGELYGAELVVCLAIRTSVSDWRN